MKNRVHEDTAKFWNIREKILQNPEFKFRNYFYTKWMFKICRRYNAVIPLQAKFEGVPITPHGLMGICISKGAVIGEKCTIFQNVTIGSNSFADSKNTGSPTLGNNVFIGANACIIGNVVIGNGVRIGAGCAVFKDVPENATVVVATPRIIEHDGTRENSFIPVKG